MAFTNITQFEEQDCINCGVRFGVPLGYTDRRRADKKTFYCPNGHSMAYTESEADRLRRERDLLQQRIAQKDDEIADAKRVAAAAKGQVTRLMNRAKAGTCPCCNRTFTNLAHHMASKHKNVGAE